MIHEQFDLVHWQGIFGTEYLAKSLPNCSPGLGITGPAHVCRLEYHRSQLQKQIDFGRSIFADVFVFALGEPLERSVTKFGGVPYRPAKVPWPRHDILDTDNKTLLLNDGELEKCLTEEDWQWMRENDGTLHGYLDESFPRLRFLAQFNFADSHDLVGTLPGDVLLLFGDYDHPFIEYYEWYPLGLTDLIDPGDVPTTGYPGRDNEFVTCYGQIHRTCDYPDAETLNRDFLGHRNFCDQAIFRPKAHRVGGMPFLIQREPTLPGRLIAVLDGIHAYSDRLWPWLNREALPKQKPNRRKPLGETRDTRTFIGLDASIYLYLDDDGKLHWEDQCT